PAIADTPRKADAGEETSGTTVDGLVVHITAEETGNDIDETPGARCLLHVCHGVCRGRRRPLQRSQQAICRTETQAFRRGPGEAVCIHFLTHRSLSLELVQRGCASRQEEQEKSEPLLLLLLFTHPSSHKVGVQDQGQRRRQRPERDGPPTQEQKTTEVASKA